MVEMDDEMFGADYSSKGELTSTGDIALVSGLDNAKQNIHNWLKTEKGFYPSVDDDYGSDIWEIFGEDFEDANMDALIVHIQNALLANPRVQGISEIVPYVTVDKRIIVTVSVILVNGSDEEIQLEL